MRNLAHGHRHSIRVIPASKDPHVIHVKRANWIPAGMNGIQPQVYTTATMIPDGMHGIEDDYHKSGWRDGGVGVALMMDRAAILDEVFRGMLARGVPEGQARILVQRAAARHAGLAGMGDIDADASAARLSKISAAAKSAQASHQAMIASMAGWEDREPGWVTTDDNLRLTFQDQLTGLQTQFVANALPVLGVEFPYQIDRTDSAGAIVLAVRDDIQNTIDLLDARKSSAVLQKTISDLSKIPLPSAGPSINFPGLPNIPWYVWGAGIGVGALALKQMLK